MQTHSAASRLAVLSSAALIGATLSCPTTAFADVKEVADFDAKIVAKQIEIDELTDRIEDANKELSRATVQSYKFSQPVDTLSWILDCEDLSSFLSHLDYLNRIQVVSQRQATTLSIQLEERQAAQDEIREMREEKAERVKELDEAKKSHYAQGDERWSNMSYFGGSMAWTGCGLCAYASVIDILTGEEIDPPDMLEMRGDWVGMDHHPDSTVGTPDGSTHAELTAQLFKLNSYNIDKDELLDEIKDDNAAAVVLVSGAVKQNDGGWWNTSGHYVCAYTYEDGTLHVQDPAGLEKGIDVTYEDDDLDRFMDSIVSIVLYKN